MKETKHDYQGCLVGNYYDSNMTGTFENWKEFQSNHLGFYYEGDSHKILCFDDRYHFVFRYDIHKQDNELYTLELCMMLQRKGIYTHLYIENISQEELDTGVTDWLAGRSEYIKSLWHEVSDVSMKKLVNNIR